MKSLFSKKMNKLLIVIINNKNDFLKKENVK
jgi:hypothetical protein